MTQDIAKMLRDAENRGIERALTAVKHVALDDAGRHLPEDNFDAWLAALNTCANAIWAMKEDGE